MSIQELIASERNYINSLEKFPNVILSYNIKVWIPIIEKYYKNPFEIVSNVLEILKLSTLVYNSMEKRGVLEAYEEYLDYFRLYSVYIINYSMALQKLSKSMIEKELSLVELQLDLLKPIQRLPQLKLIFEKISTRTEKGAIILQKVLRVAKYINDSIKEHEAFIKWRELESQLLGYPGTLVKQGRHLIKIGKAFKRNTRGNMGDHSSTRVLILLNDVLIYSSVGICENQYIFHREISLDKCEFTSIPDLKPLYSNAVSISCPDKSFIAYFESIQEKNNWVKTFDQTQKEYLNYVSRTRDLNPKTQFYAPVWIPDSFSDTCMICGITQFSLLNRKHHCRACGVLVCSACSNNGFYIPGKSDPVRSCDPCYLKLQRENKFSVAQNISQDCQSDYSWPFNITKEQIVFSMNRLSALLISNDESTRYCTLCKEMFDIFHWKYVCQECQRLVCQSCGPYHSKHLYGRILCDPCLNGIDAKDVISSGGGWSVNFDEWRSSFTDDIGMSQAENQNFDFQPTRASGDVYL